MRRRLGLSVEEWRECQLSAREMSLAMRQHVPTARVAAEYARARVVDEAGIAPLERGLAPEAGAARRALQL